MARLNGVAGVRVRALNAEEESEARERPLKPSQCRAYMRKELAREFRGIVKGFVEGAKKGNCQHVKLAAELIDAPKRTRTRTKGSAQRLLEELERDGW